MKNHYNEKEKIMGIILKIAQTIVIIQRWFVKDKYCVYTYENVRKETNIFLFILSTTKTESVFFFKFAQSLKL